LQFSHHQLFQGCGKMRCTGASSGGKKWIQPLPSSFWSCIFFHLQLVLSP
jgi:hypothetical protein